jgi:hypothetical protein
VTEFLPGTVATRTTDAGVEVLLRASLGAPQHPGWVSSGGAKGISWVLSGGSTDAGTLTDRSLADQLMWDQDEQVTLVAVNDTDVASTTVDPLPNLRAVKDSFDDEDEGEDAADGIVADRREAFFAAVLDQQVGTVLIVIDTETTTATEAALLTDDGWVSTTSTCSFLADDENHVDPEAVTVLLAPAEYDGSIA